MDYNYTKNYRRTFTGLVGYIYDQQVQRSKKKNRKVKYSLNEFRDYCNKNKKFIGLFLDWEKSYYKKDLRPTIDRIDNKKSYSFSNIQVMTWKDNYVKGTDEKRKKIVQLDLKGKKIKSFNSLTQARKQVKVNISNVSLCLHGKRKTAGGYRWRFSK